MDELPAGPEDALWRDIPIYSAAMIPQDLVEPRLLAPSTPLVGVQAAHDGARVAFRLTWNDETLDETPGPALFSDAVAIQLPQRVQPDLPDPQHVRPIQHRRDQLDHLPRERNVLRLLRINAKPAVMINQIQ